MPSRCAAAWLWPALQRALGVLVPILPIVLVLVDGAALKQQRGSHSLRSQLLKTVLGFFI